MSAEAEICEDLKEIDSFFYEQNTPNGIINQNQGQILFALGSYINVIFIWLSHDFSKLINFINSFLQMAIDYEEDNNSIPP